VSFFLDFEQNANRRQALQAQRAHIRVLIIHSVCRGNSTSTIKVKFLEDLRKAQEGGDWCNVSKGFRGKVRQYFGGGG
jgi:hypothetical protein